MQEQLFLVGIAFIFVGIFITLIASFISGSGKIESGGAIFIGPIPIIFGTNERIIYFVIGLSLITLLIFILLNKKIL